MKSVFVSGVHTVNVGDDLFMQILFERYPNTRMILYAPFVYKTIFKSFNNVVVLSKEDKPINNIMKVSELFHIPETVLIYIYIFIRYHVKCYLIVGGSLFMEGKSNIPSMLQKLHKMKFLFPRMKIAIMGSNFGPCNTTSFYKSVRQSLNYADDVCFRDKVSYDAFSDLPNVRWGNDIVLHMDIEKKEKKKNMICINIRSVDKWPTLKPYKKQYLDLIKSYITDYQQNGGCCVLVSFCEKYGDDDITNELYELLEDKSSVKRIYYKGDIKEIMETIAKSEYMVATRFHAVILGLLYGVKLLPISYSIKTENMLKTMGLWNEMYEFGHFCNSSNNILSKYVISNIEIDNSKNTQFDWLDKFLEKA